jgi:hypothetical protein
VNAPDSLQVFLEWGYQGIGEYINTIIFTFAIADYQPVIIKIKILDAQVQTFYKSQATTVEQLGHKFGRTPHVTDHSQGFLITEDGGPMAGFLGTNDFGWEGEFAAQNLAVEENNNAQSLIMRGSRKNSLDCKVDNESLDFIIPISRGWRLL